MMILDYPILHVSKLFICNKGFYSTSIDGRVFFLVGENILLIKPRLWILLLPRSICSLIYSQVFFEGEVLIGKIVDVK